MSLENAIRFGIYEGFTWIRCEGKGSFLQSPVLKECAEMRRAEGETRFVIDLGGCKGMDSTFMGFLAGLGTRMLKSKGWVQIADPGERNRKSLEDLGVDCVLDIDPPDADWCGKIDEIRAELTPFTAKLLTDAHERARHVLESHRTLVETNEENADKFANVLKILENEVSPKPEEDDPDKPEAEDSAESEADDSAESGADGSDKPAADDPDKPEAGDSAKPEKGE